MGYAIKNTIRERQRSSIAAVRFTPVKVEGFALVGVGYSKVRALGKVYNLRQPMDITGTYAEAGAGIALVGGAKNFLAKK